MSRGGLLLLACVPWVMLAACGQPFSTATELGAAGANDVGSDAPSAGTTRMLGAEGGATGSSGDAAAPAAGDATVAEGGAVGAVEPPITNAGAPGGSASEPPVAVGENGCPLLRGEKLVLAGNFCIDANEVTAAHYQAFVDGHPSLADQPKACAANTTFANNCKSTDPEKQPQRCVDWCDAHAYCASVGKHLCGSIETGGAMAYDAPVISTDNQWYAACSHAGEVIYPYGNDYDSSACWSADRPPSGVLTVRSASGCVGGYEGLWDMSGGLAEWVDSCNGNNGASDACHIRGGSFSGTSEQLRCDWQAGTSRDTSSNYIGFRCCADLPP